MVKSVNRITKSIFNYLGKERSALLLSQTGFFIDCDLVDGALWAQYDENGTITAVISGDNERCVAFASENADFEELDFVINGVVISTDKLPYKQIDKKYLLHISLENVLGCEGIKYTQFGKIQRLNDKLTPESTTVKQFLKLHGCCEGAVIEKGLQTISGGFICFNKDLAFISDVFTKEKYRGKGYGREIVKKLLNLSPCRDVYLISKEHNLGFYEKLGFEIAKEIYEYSAK